MNVQSKIENLLSQKSIVKSGGGTEKINAVHDAGKLTARERIEKFLDADSFVEKDAFIKHRSTEFGMDEVDAPGEGVVAGFGTINGRPICVYAQDYTVLNGAMGEMHGKKISRIIEQAIKLGYPIVSMIDSNGARIKEGLDALAGYGEVYLQSTLASGVVPQIALVLGECAGAAAYASQLNDFVFMVDKISSIFSVGPQVYEAAIGKPITTDELGGAAVSNEKSGNAHFIANSEEDCFTLAKQLIEFLPQNNLEDSPYFDCSDDLNRVGEELNTIMKDDDSLYDVTDIIKSFADDNEFFEVQPLYAPNIVTGFARLNGKTIALVANQNNQAEGLLTAKAAAKAADFISVCDSFNIPIASITDCPGYVLDLEAEQAGSAKDIAKLIHAFASATVPKVNLVVGKAYGSAYVTMNSKNLSADFVIAWPTAEIALTTPKTAANILYGQNIKTADNPVEARKELIELYKDTVASPYTAASKGYLDNIIEPSATRAELVAAFEMLESKRDVRPSKKHGNIPL